MRRVVDVMKNIEIVKSAIMRGKKNVLISNCIHPMNDSMNANALIGESYDVRKINDWGCMYIVMQMKYERLFFTITGRANLKTLH